ncbi:methyltransferase [Halovenus rubra]|uniref:Methyltransferase n=2 Tax=Halovenus rubra TaxID=869890 RepID=A0ABD5X8B9_9EURY|nr:methyltransferase [Halovenus rubra]
MTHVPRSLSLESKVPEGPDRYQFSTVDGLHSSDSFREPELLLLETLWERSLGDMLVVQGNYGVIPSVLGATATTITMTETSARAARLAEKNIDRNGASADVSLVVSPADIDATFDTVCYAPKPYTPLEVGKQNIIDALSCLRDGGRIYVAGDRSAGIERYETCLNEHAPRVRTVRQEGGCRVVEATRPGEVDAPEFVTSRTITSRVDGVDLTMVTEAGLFSTGKLDDGTRLLLETATVEDGETVLDLACGYGPVGTYAAVTADADVILTDENLRATNCAEATLDSVGVDGRVVTADCLRGVEDTVDRILCNPPTHAGSGVLSDLFAGAQRVLAAGGTLWAVHHRSLDLDEYLEQAGRIVGRETGPEHTVVSVRSE